MFSSAVMCLQEQAGFWAPCLHFKQSKLPLSVFINILSSYALFYFKKCLCHFKNLENTDPKQWFSNLGRHPSHLKDFVSPTPKVSDSVDLERVWRIFITNKCQMMLVPLVQRSHFENPWSREIKLTWKEGALDSRPNYVPN